MKKTIKKTIRFLFTRSFYLSAIIFFSGMFVWFFVLEYFAVNQFQEKQQKKFDEYYNIEMVNDKPPEQLIVYPEQAGIYNQSGEKMGETNKITVVYLKSGEEVFSDSVKRITMYGWVWNQSIDSNSALKFDENIRYWSNSHIIARLKSGTFLDTIYTNEKKSWKLVSVAGFIPANLLINQDEYNDISWFKRKFSNLNIIVPVTKRMGGVAIQPTTRPLVTHSSLKWQFRLGFLVVSIAVVIRILVLFYIQRSKADKTSRTVNLIVLFAAGFLSGIIFGL